MSKFSGLFEEIPFVSCDRFYGENLNSKLFFLSHCHTDHMKGLYNYIKLPGSLYASAASVVFLKKLFPNFKSPIYSLETDTPHEVEYEVNGTKYLMVITLLSARHCPGSVMFLFQTKWSNILYTGDFRITHSDFKNFKILEENPIDVIYLDSTFLHKNYNEFPSIIDSINKTLEIITEWLKLDQKNVIFLDFPANIGSEYLLTEIYRKLNEKIYVDYNQQQKYIYFPNMDKCISKNENDCRIYVTRKKFSNYHKFHHIRFIKISVMIWENWKIGDSIYKIDNNIHRILGSYHCSLKEISDFLNFVKPKNIKLNVLPDNEEKIQIMYKTLNEIYPDLDNSSIKNQKNYFNETKNKEKNDIDFTNTFTQHGKFNEDCSPPKNRTLLPKRVKLQ